MGSIRRNRSGTFQVRYRDPAGRQRARNFARKTDATRFAHAVETDKVRGDWLDPRLGRVTFGEWAEEWLDHVGHLKPKTRLDYEVNLRRHVLPVLAEAQIAALDRTTMRRLVSEMTANGAGPDVVRIAMHVARSVFAVALEAGAIKSNPASAVRLPRAAKTEMLFLTPAQVETLAAAIAPPYGTLIRFAAYTGLRAGEIGAVRVGRLDMLRGSVEVVESLSDVGGRLQFGATKTYARRHVPLPPFLRDELGRYLAGRPSDPEALIFTAAKGGPLRHNLFYRHRFKPALPAAGLPDGLRFHDLRHTYAAFCIASTADPYAVMRRMGHSSISVTYDTYGHLFPERDVQITASLEELYRRADVDSVWTRSGTEGTVRPLK
ncbi:MAG: site-specific integrase [Actinomycetota bacterium]|nr:site-specific integrase [Actinomycetota bacterium]